MHTPQSQLLVSKRANSVSGITTPEMALARVKHAETEKGIMAIIRSMRATSVCTAPAKVHNTHSSNDKHGTVAYSGSNDTHGNGNGSHNGNGTLSSSSQEYGDKSDNTLDTTVHNAVNHSHVRDAQHHVDNSSVHTPQRSHMNADTHVDDSSVHTPPSHQHHMYDSSMHTTES